MAPLRILRGMEVDIFEDGTLDLVAVGCQIVRITAPTVKDAANLQNIVAELRPSLLALPHGGAQA